MLICMCGISGSGKTTWAENYVRNNGAILISTDAIRYFINGSEESQENGDKVFALAFSRIETWLKMGKTVIFDATNIKRADRARVLKIAQKYNVYSMCYWFAPDVDKALTNQTKRKRQVPEAVIRRQANNFQIPTYYEGWDFIKEVRP